MNPTCDPSPEYSFISCVKSSVARRVGCRPAWDLWTPDVIPLLHYVLLASLNFCFVEHEKIFILNFRLLFPILLPPHGRVTIHDLIQTSLTGVNQQRIESGDYHRAVIDLDHLRQYSIHRFCNFLTNIDRKFT